MKCVVCSSTLLLLLLLQNLGTPSRQVTSARLYLDGSVGVAGVVLGDDADDEAAPEAGSHAHEGVPVLDDALRVGRVDAGELVGQGIDGDEVDQLQAQGACSGSLVRGRDLSVSAPFASCSMAQPACP